MTVRLDLEYDGSGFAGWARQPGLRSVQEVLEAGLAQILQAPVELTVAGRTDRGVHASAQVASYEGPLVRAEALNAVLPRDIAVLRSSEARDGFDARRDAASRSYRYRVLCRRERSALEEGRALWWPRRMNESLLVACAELLVGTHDFTAFTPTETYHVRFRRQVFAAQWRREGDMLLFEIEGDTFMRHMNRILVGTMLQVAAGRRELEDFAGLLEGAHRRDAGPTAPPHGLTLTGVSYASDPA
ncbi:unannotated protein [freshwater metagenome]|uniref:Unannotated protein n=1 Tax=freshwater metagenome TaxID=449393 RepID=A0A6J7IB07_9ZZZZ|nr:tRNA pseudouridine(38-40) synthase TruA [Actinomycetota bacterium]